MSRIGFASIALLLTVAAIQPARAEVAVVKNDDVTLNIGGMGQVLGFGQVLDDKYRSDTPAYVFLKTARVRMNGGYKAYSFNLEFALGGEDAVATPSPGVGLSLLDLAFNVPIPFGKSYIRVGQFKVPYGRENLTYDGQMAFNGKSIDGIGFQVGYDVGATLNLRSDLLTVMAGVFTGGGRDVPQTYIPEKLGVPLLVVRAGFGNIDEDPYYLKQTEVGGDKTKFGVFLNGLYTRDSLIGHSSVLNVKLADKSLLLNANWNPLIGKAPLDQGGYLQAGVDAAVRTPLMKDVVLSCEAEFDYARFYNKYGYLNLMGARAQGTVFFASSFEAGLRYAVLFPDNSFATTEAKTGTRFKVTGSAPIHEITPAITYYVMGQNLKVTLDFPVLVQTPVVTEKNIGAYVLTNMPNQTTTLASGGTVARQNIEQARLMVQGQF